MKPPISIAITGAAGQIGYALLFRIASGALFGPDQPVILKLIEIPQALKALNGVVMELDDCVFPLLHDILVTTDLNEGFQDVNWALLIGSVPRKAGMERSDLIGINAKIFVEQGRALERQAAEDIRLLVVGNPCNTNCLIAMNQARDIPSNRWFAMTRLDENRAKFQLARKASVPITAVTNVAVWGNHSATQYPDFYHAKINGRPATELIEKVEWFDHTFIPTVQKRGGEVIRARGLSSAASAANAIIDSVHSLTKATPEGDWHSICVCSEGAYDIPKGLIVSLPIRSDGQTWEVVPDLTLNAYSREKIDASIAELQAEKNAVQALL